MSTNGSDGGLTCGTTTNGTSSLTCIGGAPDWEGGYLAVYILIAVLFLACVIVSVMVVKQSVHNCLNLRLHPRHEPPLASRVFLCTFRGIFFIFFLFVEIYQIAGFGFSVFQAYTVWNFCFQIISLGLGFHFSLNEVCGGESDWLIFGSERYRSFLKTAHMIFLELCFPLSMLVCFVVWFLLTPLGCPLLTFTSYIQHLLNVPVFAVDFILSGHAFDLRHFTLIIFLVAVYASFVQIFYIANGGTNCVYPFMMPNCPLSVVWYISMLLIHLLFYLAAWGFWHMKFCCRRKIGGKCCALYSELDGPVPTVKRSFAQSYSNPLTKPNKLEETFKKEVNFI